MIEFKDVSMRYNGKHGKKRALDGVTFTINDGEFVFITGESGAGKTTITKLMIHEETASSGEIIVNGFNLLKMKKREIPYLRRSMGIVFQDYKLIPTLTVFENVAFALRVTGAPVKFIRNRVPYMLDLVGLADKANVYPPELSGGEQQRVALARALVNNPSLLIADEPTGNLDPRLSTEMMYLLDKINEKGTTVVIMTHEKALVNAMQKRVIAIKDGVVISDKSGGYVI
ncbi:MAG: cell division ATP-binding protein FtsE [Clostridia bacterium]|nr:cell division ATP-binding protein FtsE [Clostridia bacterium]MBR4439420.1 cell division ATP-binding protein FtsE [Clostridia bacterium]MBR5768837.1 cell division ATP-binding protein FtsE [Clostridia bacterium]